MKDFIKSIWSGELCPADECTANRKEVNYLEGLRERNREKLMKMLNEEEKATFEKYIDCDFELNWLYCEEAFITGVRYAVKLFTEALG